MKDKIIELKTGVQYYILKELEYKSKKYAYAMQCDLKNDTLDEENPVVMELINENDNIVVKEIEDDNIALEVIKEFQKKFQEE